MFILTKKSAIIASFFLLAIVFSSFIIKFTVFEKIKLHNNDICPVCRQVFDSSQLEKAYISAVNGNGYLEIECTNCGYIYKKDCNIHKNVVK